MGLACRFFRDMMKHMYIHPKGKLMNKLKTLSTGCILALSFSSTSSQAYYGQEQGFFLNPYVAAEAAWRDLSWETDLGDGHFRENFANVNLIAGAQFHNYFALEGGFQATDRRQQQSFYLGDGTVAAPALGFIDPGLDSATHHADAELRGWHLNLVGLWPVLPDTTLYASVGAAWMRFYVSTVPTTTTNTAQPVARWESNHKAMLRLGLGVKQMITDHFGARVFFNWENTNKLEGRTLGQFVVTEVPTLDTEFYTAKTKNSYLVGLGFFYQLCPNKA